MIFIFGLFFLCPVTLSNSLSKPLLQELFVPRNLVENKTVKLSCVSVQGESINFQWFHNNRKLESDRRIKIKDHDESSELTIKSLNIDDSGEYRCLGRNGYGEDEQKVLLDFKVKPKWTNEPNDVLENLSKELTLNCEAKGQPNPEIKWIQLDRNRSIKKEIQSTKLSIRLTPETAGIYRCIATNQLGSIEKTIRVVYFGEYFFDRKTDR